MKIQIEATVIELDQLISPKDLSMIPMGYTIRMIKRGIFEPLIITDDYQIIQGHDFYEAAKQMELEVVPCVFQREIYQAIDGVRRSRCH